jgi:hypothetical protein
MQSLLEIPPSFAAYNSPGLEQSAPKLGISDLRALIIFGLLFAIML